MSVGTSVGSKRRGMLPVPGIEVEIPFTEIRGQTDGPTVLVSGGVHGGEYPGIAAVIEVARRLDPAQLRGRVIVLHLTNPPAFWARSQYWNPLDGKNLNRCFPGDPAGSASERMAAAVIGVAREAQFWVDLHGGDIHEALIPFTIYSSVGSEDVRQTARRMAEAYGIPRLLESSSVAGGSYQAAAELGIAAILPEAGQVGQLDQVSERMHVEGVENVLRLLGVLDGRPREPGPAETYRSFVWSRAEVQGLWRSAVSVGQRVQEGQIAGVLTDVYGDALKVVPAPADGEVLFAATSYAIGEGDPLLAVGAP